MLVQEKSTRTVSRMPIRVGIEKVEGITENTMITMYRNGMFDQISISR